jgi:tetratricopeptide (TPR) repeat protein
MQKLLYFVPIIGTLLFTACGQTEGDQGGTSKPSELSDIEKRILAAPDDASLFAERARYFETLDSARLAVNDWKRAIALDSTNKQYHLALADLFYRKVKVAEAEAQLRKAIGLSAEDTEARLKLSELKLIQREYSEAMELANAALRIDPQHAKGYYLKGWIHMEVGDTALAVSSYRTAVERDPDFYDAYLQMGQLHAAMRDRLAWEYYNSALELRPNSIEAWYGLGMLAQESGQDSLAMVAYARIKEIDPRNPLAWYNSGYVLLELRDQPAAARIEFGQAIKLMPTWADAYYNRGLTYELEDRLDSAYSDYRLALELAPDMTLAAQGLSRLQSRGVRVAM